MTRSKPKPHVIIARFSPGDYGLSENLAHNLIRRLQDFADDHGLTLTYEVEPQAD